MSKMSELSAIIGEIRKCGESLIDISDALRDLFGEEVEENPEPEKPKVTLEQVRAVLAEKSVAGFRAEVQGLIQKYGGDKLSAVDPSRYAQLMADAEVL
ncbi:DNA ligase [Eubacteriales bacterium OttesenSCG-928-N13]|nr:DNA ligase [Eubacteriales bacterium OttesenSCG-928-N13]